jgi:hypothetical protein
VVYPHVWNAGLQTLFDMIGYDTSGLSTQQLDDGFRFMAEFLHPDDAPTLHLCIVNLINTSVAANIMPADFTGIYIYNKSFSSLENHLW